MVRIRSFRVSSEVIYILDNHSVTRPNSSDQQTRAMRVVSLTECD